MSEQENITELTRQAARLSHQILGGHGKMGDGGEVHAVYSSAVRPPCWVVSVRVKDNGRTDNQFLYANNADPMAALLALRHALGEMLRGERPVIGGEV